MILATRWYVGFMSNRPMRTVFELGRAIALVTLLVPVVYAQSESSPDRTAWLEETVVTASRTPEDPLEIARSISIINQQQVEQTAHLHIQELLNQQAGVGFHRNNGQEYLAAVRSPVLTGAGSCGSLLTAEDGVPLRPIGFCNVNELFEAHSEQASSIEILRGPGTAVHGSKAIHGVINVLDVVNLERAPRIGLEAGAYGFARLKLSAANGDSGLAFTGTRDGGYRDQSGYDQQKLSLRHRQLYRQLTLDTRFTATNLSQETAGFIVGLNAFQDSALARSNPNPEAYRDAHSVRLSTRIESTQGWQITPYARWNQMEFLQHFLPGQPLEQNSHYSLGLLSRKSWALDTNVDLVAGLDLEYADSSLRQFQDGPTIGSAFLQATVPQGGHYDYDVESRVLSPFAELSWDINSYLNLVLGARFERASYSYQNFLPVGRSRDDGTLCGFGGCRYSRPADRNDSFSNLSPKLSLIYEPEPRQRLYVSLGNGFRAAEFTELYRLQRAQSTANLDSEEIDSLELGWRYRDAKLFAEVAVFDMDKKNVILRDVDFFNVSNGRTRHQGLETSLRVRVAQHWSWVFNASYARHQYRNNPGLSRSDVIGNDIDTAPRRFGSTSLLYQPADGRSIQFEWQHLGAYFSDPENQHRYNGHNLVHVRANWRFNPRWRASVRLNNLLDKAYAERADFTGFSGDRYFPGQPRRIYLGIEYQM